MASRRRTEPNPDETPRLPAKTLEGRESEMIALTVDLAERQLRDGTASSQIMTHYLKLATTREQLERDKLELEAELLRAKSEAIQSQQRSEELFAQALNAMRSYSGNPEDNEEDEYYD